MADKSDISDSNSDSEGEKHDEEGKDDQSKTMVEQTFNRGRPFFQNLLK
jgi:hypothetical protein